MFTASRTASTVVSVPHRHPVALQLSQDPVTSEFLFVILLCQNFLTHADVVLFPRAPTIENEQKITFCALILYFLLQLTLE